MYMGGKIRFYHALVIEFALRRKDVLTNCRNVIRLTCEHGGRLGVMSML